MVSPVLLSPAQDLQQITKGLTQKGGLRERDQTRCWQLKAQIN